MPAALELTQQRFGRLVAIAPAGVDRHRNRLWVWHCDCGKQITRPASAMRKGVQVSCGCHKDERSRERAVHGMWKTRTYKAWLGIKYRTGGADPHSFDNYAGRGITMFDGWRESFELFLKDMGGCPAGMTIERTDNDKGYFPGNCCWATQHDQTRNTRRTIRVNVGGVEYCLKDACALMGRNYDKVRSRIRGGMDAQAALERA